MKETLLSRLDSSVVPTILVIGDLMADIYVWGDVDRISPEAPVQVLNVEAEESRPGGAGNVAWNLATLGAHVKCFGIVGDDANGRSLRRMLKKLKIDVSGIISDKTRPTTVKTRIIAHSQQLLRVDHEDSSSIDASRRREMLKCLKGSIKTCDAVLIPDYGKGALPAAVLAEIIAACAKAGKPVLVDPARGRSFRDYAGCSILKPNRVEAEVASGIKITDTETLGLAAKKLLRSSRAENLIITQGGDGMTIFRKGAAPFHIAGISRPVYDVTGAGDTVLSLLGYVLAGGGTIEEASAIANVAGGLVVGKVGTVSITREELDAELHASQQIASHKLKSAKDISAICREHRLRKQTIVFTNGCFDLLHAGHIKLLHFAGGKGDILVVGLNSDKSVRKLKGAGRPVLGQDERGYILSALEQVDYIVIFDESTPLKIIKAVRPDVLVKGADYTHDTVVGRDLVESYGGGVELAPLIEGVSSTGIMAKIANGKQPS